MYRFSFRCKANGIDIYWEFIIDIMTQKKEEKGFALDFFQNTSDIF